MGNFKLKNTQKPKTSTIYWQTGQREVIEGPSIAEAFTNAGYGLGALHAVDFIVDGDDQSYTWNPKHRKWEKK